MKRLVCYFILLILTILNIKNACAQGSAGSKTFYESRYIVDMPTAGVIPKGTYSAYMQSFYNGGIMLEADAAFFRNFNFGLSYSGTGIIGDGKVVWQNLPGFHLRFRIIDETLQVPAILIGANTQGKGAYYSTPKRFQTMSPGIFAAVSKNFKWALGTIAAHGGITYSFEPLPANRMINIYAGIEQSLGSYASFNLEFNPTLDETSQYLKSKGLLNASLRFSFAKGMTAELQVRDMLSNIKDCNGFARTFGFEFIRPF